jgi:hypothetical protein
MKIDLSRAVGGYAAVMTIACAWLLLSAASGSSLPHFKEIDVERINIREPDGTLRMTISDHARMPGIIIGQHQYPHPNRPEAGMIFYNNEGAENGGLVFDGAMVDGTPTNGGSLTFDRYHQDQTVQVTSLENGPDRLAGVYVNDRPDQPMDFARAGAIVAMPDGPAKTAAASAGNYIGKQWLFLGRGYDKSSSLVLRDGDGKKRLVLSVAEDGKSQIQFLDQNEKVTRVIEQ